MNMQNQTLIPFLCPASKRSTGILSLVAAFVDEYKFLTNWHLIDFQGWKLPAISKPHEWCGLWMNRGCLNKKLHVKLGAGNRIYLKKFQRSCYRASCKNCYLKWMARQANNATRRIEQYTKNTGKKPIHLILIVNPTQHHLPVKLLRQRMSHILKIAELDGASVAFHPFRFNHDTRQWYVWPHFHLVGFGDEQKIRQSFGRYGWFVKNEKERDSVFQTFCYILSHCGTKKGYQTVTWFGDLSYSKMPSEKEPKITCCPVCGGDFEEIYYEEEFHPVVPPDKPYEGLVDAEGWHPVRSYVEEMPTDFEYSSIRDLNELLKGLALAN